MYKKTTTTTTTVEEHSELETPALADVFSPVLPTNTNSGIKLRMDARDHGGRYTALVRNYIISKVSKIDDITTVGPALMLEANQNLIPFFSNFNTADVISKFLNSYELFTTDLLVLIDTIVGGADFATEKEKLNSDIALVASTLGAMGANIWPTTSTTNVLSGYVNSIVNQVQYRKKSTWDSELVEFNNGYQIMVTGATTGATSFYDALSLGIIQMTPWRFTA